jgi:hypothetical protein
MSVERSIRVCAHKGEAKITPGRDDTRAIFNDVTSRRAFLSQIKGVFAACDDNCHLRRQINERFVIIRQRTRCVLLGDRYRAFFKDKNHFSTGFQPRFASRVVKDAISTGRSTFTIIRGLFPRSFAHFRRAG